MKYAILLDQLHLKDSVTFVFCHKSFHSDTVMRISTCVFTHCLCLHVGAVGAKHLDPDDTVSAQAIFISLCHVIIVWCVWQLMGTPHIFMNCVCVWVCLFIEVFLETAALIIVFSFFSSITMYTINSRHYL